MHLKSRGLFLGMAVFLGFLAFCFLWKRDAIPWLNAGVSGNYSVRSANTELALEGRTHARPNQAVREVSKLAGSLSVAERWKEITADYLSIEEKQLRFRSLVGAVAPGEMGELETLIVTSFPVGNLRDSLISILFSNRQDNVGSLLKSAASLEERSDRESAVGAIAASIRSGRVLVEDLEGAPLETAFISSIVTQGLWGRLVELDRQGNLTKDDIDGAYQSLRILASDSPEKSKIYEDFMHKLSVVNAEEAYRLTLASEGELGDSRIKSTLERVLKQLASSDPQAAAGYAIENQIDTAGIFVEWMRQDSNMAATWYSKNEAALDDTQKSAYLNSSANWAMKAGDLKEAKEIASRISDPALRRKAEGDIWTTERDSLRREINTDPYETMKEIVTAKSQYEDYWIEEAMMTWISKEPEKAESWYQENWNSLPPAKSQYVAAAYAKNALGLGDTATARQWTGLIQDPKTRERIEASITQAEASGER